MPTVTNNRRVKSSNIQQEWTTEETETDMNPLRIGDSVYLKPRQPSCTSRWTGPFQVSRLPNNWSVDLGDGVNRHISQVRRVYEDDSGPDNGDDEDDNEADVNVSDNVSDVADDASTGSGADSEQWHARLRDRSKLRTPSYRD